MDRSSPVAVDVVAVDVRRPEVTGFEEAGRFELGALAPEHREPAAAQTIRLVGTVDVRSVGAMRTLLHTAIDGGRGPLHVDVGELELGDHAGLGVLLGGARRARAAGRSLVLVDVSAALGRLLAVDRLGRMLRVQERAELLTPEPA